MSWERMYEIKEKAVCACGAGAVTRTAYAEMDDWNRWEEGVYGEKIECEECVRKYHIESVSESYLSPDGYVRKRKDYLVPDGMTLDIKTKPIRLPFEWCAGFSEKVVVLFSKEELQESIEDMKKSKFSTRVFLASSRKIIEMHLKYKKSQKLANVIASLEDCVLNYDKYEWTKERVEKFRKQEMAEIEENKKKLQQVLSQSHELKYEEYE